MPEPIPLNERIVLFRREGPDALRTNHPDPVLLVTMPEDNEGPVGFRTSTVNARAIKAAASFTDQEAEAAIKVDGLKVISIVKSKSNPWKGRISVGRARNSDMVIFHPSVSKLHGHFVVEDDVTTFVDAGSTNGTKINGRKLAPKESVVLKPRDAIELGAVGCDFHTAESLTELLSGLFEA